MGLVCTFEGNHPIFPVRSLMPSGSRQSSCPCGCLPVRRLPFGLDWRRYVAIIGACFIVIGMIICSTAHSMNIFICECVGLSIRDPPWLTCIPGGMTLAGVGAGINELTALAATSELAPTRKRGKYVAVLIFTIVPFCPSVLWGQLIATHAGWRYCGALCGAWAAVGLIMTLVFYFPPPRVNSKGLTRKDIIQQIDFTGGFLSISGMILFMAGMQWGGYQVRQLLSFIVNHPDVLLS